MAPEDPQLPAIPESMHLLIPIDLARLLHSELDYELERIKQVTDFAQKTRAKADALADPASNAPEDAKTEAKAAAEAAAFAAERAEYAVLVMKPETASRLFDMMAKGLFAAAAFTSRVAIVHEDEVP